MPDVEPQDDLAFDTAFAEALGGALGDDAGGDEPNPSDEPQQVADPLDAEPENAPPSSAEGANPPSEVTPPAPANEELTALKAQVEALSAKQKEVPAEPVKQELPAEIPAVDDPEFTAFKQDWPDIARMMEARETKLKNELSDVMKTIDSMKQELLSKVAPIEQQYHQSAADKFISEVKSKHADAFDLLPAVEDWVKTLPLYLQVGAEHVLTKGTSADVVALYDDFKKATNRVQPPQTPPAQIDEVAQKRMSRMAAVQATRSSVAGNAPDANDFDGSFALAVQSMK